MSTVRLFLSVASAKAWPIHQIKIHNAFLHGNLTEEVYMKLLRGFKAADPTTVCHLLKLKQRPGW